MNKQCTGCVVSAGTHKPAEALHQQIDEPQVDAMRGNTAGGVRCHDADACAMGQLPCPTPKFCGCEPTGGLHQIAEPDEYPALPEPAERAVYATSKNTPAVRKGFEPSGWRKKPDFFTADQMRAFVDADRAKRAAAPQAVQYVPWCPDVCPITGRKFFMWIEHWATGKDVPTYGGPYDSYTIPVKEQDGTFTCERYDHDAGEWMTEGMGWECVGVMLVDDQSFVVDPKNPRYMEIEEFATQPAAQGMDAQQYRLVERGELIEAGDQFLRDDFTWQIDPQGIFVGMPHGAGLRPARRALAAQAKHGGA